METRWLRSGNRFILLDEDLVKLTRSSDSGNTSNESVWGFISLQIIHGNNSKKESALHSFSLKRLGSDLGHP